MIKSPEQQKLNQEVELAEESQARAVVYNFLSSLFAKEVTSDLVTQLTSTQGQSFLNSLALEPSLSAPISEINTKLIKLAELNSKESLLELAADFCGLFLVDGRTCASPYAGQYLTAFPSDAIKGLGGKRKKDQIQIFGELHQQMTAFLTESKLQVHSDFPEPGDHIAVILAYIAHLCVTVDHKEQLEFINSYLMTWLSDFTEQVNKHDHGLFYSDVANLTLQWLHIDVEDLQSE
jgi:TorA-specific chaperone